MILWNHEIGVWGIPKNLFYIIRKRFRASYQMARSGFAKVAGPHAVDDPMHGDFSLEHFVSLAKCDALQGTHKWTKIRLEVPPRATHSHPTLIDWMLHCSTHFLLIWTQQCCNKQWMHMQQGVFIQPGGACLCRLYSDNERCVYAAMCHRCGSQTGIQQSHVHATVSRNRFISESLQKLL